MTLLKIITYPDPVLKQVCSPVTDFNGSLAKLLDNMFATMYAGSGIGLAGPQVAVSQRLLVSDVSFEGKRKIELINPEIINSADKIVYEEGCLSVPGYREKVQRKAKITVKAQNRHGEFFTMDAEGVQAVCIQHEMDHLDGILFVDRLSTLKKGLFKAWYKKNAPLADEA